MNSLASPLVEFVATAETPLYSGKSVLEKELGHEIALDGYLSLVGELISDDFLRLWQFDPTTRQATRVERIPVDLAQSYRALSGLKDSYDPFGFSLALGPASEQNPQPVWEADLDFEGGAFQMTVPAAALSAVQRRLAQVFPQVDFVEEGRRTTERGLVIWGRLAES